MTVSENQEQFKKWRGKYMYRALKSDRLFERISTFRILAFLVGAVALIIGITEKEKAYATVLIVVGILFLVGFLVLVKWHSKVVIRQQVFRDKFQVCDRYCNRFTEKWREFEDNGSSYLNEYDSVSADVDLIGENSLYQMISVCHTEKGKQILANDLAGRYIEEEEREKRYAAIKELSEKLEFAVEFEAAGLRTEAEKEKFDANEFEAFCGDEQQGKLSVLGHIVRFVLPICEITSLVLFLTGVISYGYPLVGFLVLLVLSWLTKFRTDAIIQPVYYASAVSGEYEKMLSLVAEQEFKSDILSDMQQRAGGANGAVRAYHKLKAIGQAYNISFNPLVHQILCGFLLWDYQLAAIVARWKKIYGAQVAGCSDMLGNLEELMSFAVLAMVRETGEGQIDYTEKDVYLEGVNLYHPLLMPDQAQGNDVKLTSGITIITGSNMSGKTTFLRTIAVNLVLAYLGAPVCAEQLKASYMRIFTSMRVKDDVAHGISTFYAEILRIKDMAGYRKEEKPMLCLIDEIFKGTNSADRIVGAREVITQLAGARCMTVVSTHDFELCSITDKNQTPAVNYHFQEYYEGDELRFDYKIRDGRCTTTNARAILRMAGFEV